MTQEMPCGCGDVKQETPIRSVLMNRRLLWAAGTPTSEELLRGFFGGGATFVSEYYLEFYRQIWGWWKGARRSRKSSISWSVKSNNTVCSLVLASGSTSWIIYYSLMRHWRLQFSKVSWSKLVLKRSYKRTTCFRIVVSKVSGIIC